MRWRIAAQWAAVRTKATWLLLRSEQGVLVHGEAKGGKAAAMRLLGRGEAERQHTEWQVAETEAQAVAVERECAWPRAAPCLQAAGVRTGQVLRGGCITVAGLAL